MKQLYDFDELIQRRDTASVKWDSSTDPDMLPMWVADMDFRTAPAITEAIRRRAESGIFGYVSVPDSYYSAVVSWFGRRHGWTMEKNHIISIPGIVPALSVIVKALVPEGKGVIFQSPAYNCFFSCVKDNGRRIVENTLVRRTVGNGFTFEIDFDSLEKQASDSDNHLLILCNPHNPTGRVWSRAELEKVRDICRRHGVTVLSDEIHCELVHPGYKYIPYATVDSECVTCCSPSKGFNIAGLQISNIISSRDDLRSSIQKEISVRETGHVNPFGVEALKAAYNEGEEWLDGLNRYLLDNYNYLCETLAYRMPSLGISRSEATYLAWVDITSLRLTATEVEERAAKEGHVWINAGAMYGDDRYVRINYACPRARLAEGLDRFCRTFGC